MNLKFWEWFKEKQAADPTLLDPTDEKVLKEYQDAIGIKRIPFQSIDRCDLTTSEVTNNPDLGTDTPETLALKLKYGIHQSVMPGPDTHMVSGVRAISMGGIVEVIHKVDKSKLFELGYDITEENETFVKNLGLDGAPLPEGATAKTPEEERLHLEGVDFKHYTGKPQSRPWEMQSLTGSPPIEARRQPRVDRCCDLPAHAGAAPYAQQLSVVEVRRCPCTTNPDRT